MELLSQEFKGATVVSVGHRPELEAFHGRKIMLQRGRAGAKLVSDLYLVPKPVVPSGRSWMGLLSIWNSSFKDRKIRSDAVLDCPLSGARKRPLIVLAETGS
jgi:putative ATP-binding cassette transporter